ncbi:MAG TPA: hypothetical protein VKB93_28435 [Thermoanaerobaculia bacterium]|nr:hypothetical protein [Thermoanaerobaculia bacterium]
MNKATDNPDDDEMRPEYDLRGGVRGKYYERYRQGTNMVLLDPDIAEIFRNSEAVNAALRQFLSEHGAPSEASKIGGLTPRRS